MENKKEMTIPNVSAATDAEQSLSKCTDNSIVNQDTDFKGYEQSFEEMQREILRQLDPSYLKTVSMTTLYDTVFEVQTPLIDGLLQRGTYLFVGSPKVGKSFMMAQLAYHISTGKRGLDTRVSLKQALATQGFKGGSRGDTEWSQWIQSEKEQLAAVMERYGIEWEHLSTKRT